MKFTTYRLNEICDAKSGKRLPLGSDFSKEITKYKYIRARDIKQGKIDVSNCGYISEEVKKKISKYIIEENDVAITIVANIGDVGFCGQDASGANLTENAVRLTNFNPQKCFSKYLAYYLAQPCLKKYMEGLAIGAAQAKLGIYKVNQIKVQLPLVEEQKKITSIIENYDNLIENNNKRIKILEQMVENLYKEWFVRFRFPGHETVPIENGIPKGWRIDKIENISNVTDGVHNTIQDTPNSPYLLLSCKNIKDGKIQIGENERTIDEKTFFTLRKRTQLSKGDILITSVGTIGDVHLLNQEPSYIEFQRSVAIIKPNKELVNSCYLYETFKSMRKEFENAAHGAAQQCLFIGDINRMKVCLPPFKICQLFEKKVQQIYDLILTLSNQCDNLIKQRDLLLPRLMSGKLAV
ncbi:restriction endonuclease subunit S [Fibrobacter sp. UWH4]|uniref:restriction endonuclease subunit S n=1 Tax=Fibrobacter sp. UWH4 TaxID=1896210 RepID=UPI0009197D63|nr:restriction endonuclease subunit S [Fibrobacter sp. UWH4]SHL69716.1 type I restriction enzyme, S subunit [Fibrobacter sp. UWH4]